jgi:hypothetical protein
MLPLLKEYFQYLTREKKWWLKPLVAVLVVMGTLLVLGATTGLGWAIYPFM